MTARPYQRQSAKWRRDQGGVLQVPAPFEYERATSVEEALALLEEHGPDARLLAGGHSLLPMMKLRLASPEYVIDIDPLAREVDGIWHADAHSLDKGEFEQAHAIALLRAAEIEIGTTPRPKPP